jgi:glycosyltransferase involved in cell wall biosynthesis
MKVLFLMPYPGGQAPSQRFRFEQYTELLSRQGHMLKFQSFTSQADWLSLYSTSNPFTRFLIIIKGVIKRFIVLFSVPFQDFIFIHREVTPLGPPVFEWIIARVFRKKIIYDFDDAIWLTDKEESRLEQWLRWRSKVGAICRWSYRVSCGNEYLATYARKFNASVVVNPTTIDTETLHHPARLQQAKHPEQVVIGWTGSHSTIKYLNQLVPVLKNLEQKFPQVSFLVIANRNPQLPLQRCVFLPWRKESEVEDLARIAIGIMPLPDDEWTRGKCGFKALQYMALEIPCVASPVGVNTRIIEHGNTGLLAATPNEWNSCLTALITDNQLRTKIGKAGRKKVKQYYSVTSNASLFMSLFA